MHPLDSNARPATIEGYVMNGGPIVRDQTKGIAKLIFYNNSFKLLVNDKTLTQPASVLPITFICGEVSFKIEDLFIKITGLHKKEETVLYADLRPPVGDSAYYAYSYKPKELTQAEALKKIAHSSEKFPGLAIDIFAHNRHGAALFGKIKGSDVLFWAAPHEDEIQQKACLECKREGETFLAKSQDGKVSFHGSLKGEFYINAESAIKLL